VNFHNNAKKSAQAVARLIATSGCPIDYLRISKLIYLADRESIISRGIPIVGGHYFSMRKGPTISEIMDFVGNRNAPGWKETISPRFGNEVRLINAPEFGSLSDSELKILDKTVKDHSGRTTEELVDWCHKHCPEYEVVLATRRKPIEVETILKGANKSPGKIQKLIDDAKELEELDALLT
jgi:hypothetical protein